MHKFGSREWSESTQCSKFAKVKQIQVCLVLGREATEEPCACCPVFHGKTWATNGINKSYFKAHQVFPRPQ